MATDHSSEVKHKRIPKLRDHRNKLSDQEWETTLISALTQRRISKAEADHLEKLEVIASIINESLVITLRHNISGITQKLGEIVLKADVEQELDIIGWAYTAVERSNNLESEVQDLEAKYDEQSRTMEKLNKQLDDLIIAKREHEDSLLEKFRELLNTKKLKIRDQQRLLAGAKADPRQAEQVQNARVNEERRKPNTSRAGKRKINDAATEQDKSSEEDNFEPQLPTQRKEESDLSEQADTPEPSDQEITADESDDDLDSAPKLKSNSWQGKQTEVTLDASQSVHTKSEELPPRRELPFKKVDAKITEDKSALDQKASNENEETDDDDDDDDEL